MEYEGGARLTHKIPAGPEILATEMGGNQTISGGGVFFTPPIVAADCEAP